MYAIERRTPTSLAHRGRQAGKVALYTAATAAMTVAIVLVAVLVAVAEIVLSVFVNRRRRPDVDGGPVESEIVATHHRPRDAPSARLTTVSSSTARSPRRARRMRRPTRRPTQPVSRLVPCRLGLVFLRDVARRVLRRPRGAVVARRLVVVAARGEALLRLALAGDRRDRGEDLVREARPVGVRGGRRRDADDDLVLVDLLEADVRLGADRRA